MAIHMSLCWECARSNAIKGLRRSLHSKKHKLPKGAVYETVIFKRGSRCEGTYPAYKVLECPHFVEETKEVKDKLKRYRISHAENVTAAEVRLYQVLLDKEEM